MSADVTCLACGAVRVASDEELQARSVAPCPGCGNGSYTGVDWRTFEPPAPPPTEPAPEPPTEPEVSP
jgi:hypothetical protein